MRVYVGTLTLFAALLGGNGALEAQQLREDSYRWYMGPQGGVLLFQTQTQDYATITERRSVRSSSWEGAAASCSRSTRPWAATRPRRSVTLPRPMAHVR